MKIELSTKAIKFLNKQDEKIRTNIIMKIKNLKREIEVTGILPYKTFDIKALHGEWHPHKRLRIGNIRIVFIVNISENVIQIPIIDNRGDVY